MENETQEKIYSMVTTTRGKYFGVITKKDKTVVIDSVLELKETDTETKIIAINYIKGMLYGDNKRIELSENLVESITERPDETRLIKTFEAIIPEATKRAMGIITFKAMEDLISKWP